MGISLQSRGKNVFTAQKKEQITVDTNDLNKAGALWQTFRLSSASYDGFNLLN